MFEDDEDFENLEFAAGILEENSRKNPGSPFKPIFENQAAMFDDNELFEQSIDEVMFSQMLDTNKNVQNVQNVQGPKKPLGSGKPDEGRIEFKRPLEPASTLNRPGIVQGKRSGTNVPSPPKEGKRKFPGIETHTTSPPKEGKRKFPGPAGILPKLAPGCRKVVPEEDPGEKDEKEEHAVSSQDNEEVDLSSCVVWRKAVQEMDMDKKDALLHEYNTAWIHAKSSSGTSKKLPFFLAKIKSVDLTRMDPSCLLTDLQGTVCGSIHRQVIEKYGDYIHSQAVLVLQDVAVLITPKTYYVMITLNNILAIYSPKQVKHVCRLTKLELEKAASEHQQLRQLQLEEILKDVEGGVPEVPRVPIGVPGAPIGAPGGGVELEKAVTQVGEQLSTYNRSSNISSNSSLIGLQRRANPPVSSAQSGLSHLNTGSATSFQLNLSGYNSNLNSSVHSSNLDLSVHNSNSFNHKSLNQEHSDRHKLISLPRPSNTSLPRASNTSLPRPSNTSLPRPSNTSLPRASNTSLPCPSNTSLPRASNTSLPRPSNASLSRASNTSLPSSSHTSLPLNVSSPNLTMPPSDQETSIVREGEEIGNVSQPRTGSPTTDIFLRPAPPSAKKGKFVFKPSGGSSQSSQSTSQSIMAPSPTVLAGKPPGADAASKFKESPAPSTVQKSGWGHITVPVRGTRLSKPADNQTISSSQALIDDLISDLDDDIFSGF